ncbi:hypothetical protein PPACK8108_LOCUS20720 [Phakopsora pachyrhizi]|uniref:DUF4283 domain-containing protein n=1 Tax=Phakopsora pachyrhizi TaxID=170000 RepID=A0AAV0BFQ2_PHAPC|nr:hypothetical protein PPACK8108_LOCUS20720 [Phakopsora pachyrhizi]
MELKFEPWVGTVDEVKKQIELGLLGPSKGRIQLVVLMNLHLKFRNKERTKEIQDLRGNPLDNEEERSFEKSNQEDQGLMKWELKIRGRYQCLGWLVQGSDDPGWEGQCGLSTEIPGNKKLELHEGRSSMDSFKMIDEGELITPPVNRTTREIQTALQLACDFLLKREKRIVAGLRRGGETRVQLITGTSTSVDNKVCWRGATKSRDKLNIAHGEEISP